jgi:hypothetical protein
MKEVLKIALVAKYTGELAEANANIAVYLRNPSGIGEHSDIVAAINEQVEKGANAKEKLDFITSLDG